MAEHPQIPQQLINQRDNTGRSGTPQDPLLTCPYNDSHIILKSRFQRHLIRCMKVNPTSLKVVCPFNATHRVDSSKLKEHMQECSNLSNLLAFKYAVGQPGAKVMTVENREIESTENWDDDADSPSYEPEKHLLENGQLLVHMKGGTPSEKAKYREMRHLLYSKEKGAPSTSTEESGMTDPLLSLDQSGSRTESTVSTLSPPSSHMDSTFGIESLALSDTENFYFKNRPLVDGSTTDSASFSSEFPWMALSTEKSGSCVTSLSSAEEDYSCHSPVMNISSDAVVIGSARSLRSEAMSLCSESASQASLTPRKAGQGLSVTLGHQSVLETPNTKIMRKSRIAAALSLKFDDFAPSTEHADDFADSELISRDLRQERQPWAIENAATDFLGQSKSSSLKGEATQGSQDQDI